MLYIDISTCRRKIAQIEIQNKGKDDKQAGSYVYDVLYRRGTLIMRFTLTHVRVEGVTKLLKKVMGRIEREVKKHYAIPMNKVIRHGNIDCIKSSDIPQRYAKPFGKWIVGQTCAVIDGECAIYLHDLQRWIDWEVAGVVPMFD